jgi:hypothetical protein
LFSDAQHFSFFFGIDVRFRITVELSQAMNVCSQVLSLDMLVWWNSTYEMVSAVIKLQTPITAICATQQMNLSMRDIALTLEGYQDVKGDIEEQASSIFRLTDVITL